MHAVVFEQYQTFPVLTEVETILVIGITAVLSTGELRLGRESRVASVVARGLWLLLLLTEGLGRAVILRLVGHVLQRGRCDWVCQT